ncbi:hypothetical protein JOE21_000387 [Desmospora profundinema]|uniref:Uncharacterized protein n=1 Tax=Desmospora profundinema TaxID=1571184 RepID=A0ABU1IK89_9BACL|nr:hypothetical protein [Desmospora profundinema]
MTEGKRTNTTFTSVVEVEVDDLARTVAEVTI